MTSDITNATPVATKDAVSVRRLRTAVARARWSLWVEDLFPRSWPSITVGTLFLTSSWAGLWQSLPQGGRMAGVALFGLAQLGALWPLRGLRFPDEKAGLARIDANTGLPHRPASAFADKVAGNDPSALALWDLHLQRISAQVGGFRAGFPDIGRVLTQKDTRALHAPLLLVAFIAWGVASGERYDRIAAAFDWSGPEAPLPPLRIDAWMSPPPYTGLPTVFLAGETVPAPAGPVDTPQGSVLSLLINGRDIGAQISGGARVLEEARDLAQHATQYKIEFTDNAAVEVGGLRWEFAVRADRKPVVTVTGQPKTIAPRAGGLSPDVVIPYELTDDYPGTAVSGGTFRPVLPDSGVAGPAFRFELK